MGNNTQTKRDGTMKTFFFAMMILAVVGAAVIGNLMNLSAQVQAGLNTVAM